MENGKKKSIYKKWWLWVVAVLILAALGSQGGKMGTKKVTTKGEDTKSSETVKPKKTRHLPSGFDVEVPDGLTMAAFGKITDGMSKDDVDFLAGGSGTLQSSAGSGGYQMDIYSYPGVDAGSGTATVSFTNGKVSAKFQMGLI
jgi:hypothetical protein